MKHFKLALSLIYRLPCCQDRDSKALLTHHYKTHKNKYVVYRHHSLKAIKIVGVNSEFWDGNEF